MIEKDPVFINRTDGALPVISEADLLFNFSN